MPRVIIAILLFWAISVSFAQEESLKYKYFSPEYAPADVEFQLTNLIKFPEDSIISFFNRLIIDRNFELDSVKLCLVDTSFIIQYYRPDNDEPLKNVFEIKLINQDSSFIRSPFVQLLYFGKALSPEVINFHFKYKYAFAEDSSYEFPPMFVNTAEGKINIYDRTLFSDKAIKLKGGFTVTLKDDLPKQDGLLSFWMKFPEVENNSFFITANDGTDSLLKFTFTPSGLISFRFDDKLFVWDDAFISEFIWNKFSFFFNSEKEEIEFEINGQLIATVAQVNASFLRDVSFELVNGEHSVCVDELFYGIDGRDLHPAKGVHFVSSYNDSLKLLYSNSFDNIAENRGDEKVLVEFDYSSAELQEANLPVFSPAPELYMDYFINYYELQWKPQNAKLAKEFIVQKSLDGDFFEDIYIVDADTELTEKVYSFSDAKDINSEIVFYRVLQINKDNSEVYSNQLKVGQGEIEEFSLDQNYPNPFNPVTNITLEVFVPGEYVISVYDLVGKKIALVYQGNLSSGKHTFPFDGSELPSGIYFYEVVSPSFSQVMKMILAK